MKEAFKKVFLIYNISKTISWQLKTILKTLIKIEREESLLFWLEDRQTLVSSFPSELGLKMRHEIKITRPLLTTLMTHNVSDWRLATKLKEEVGI